MYSTELDSTQRLSDHKSNRIQPVLHRLAAMGRIWATVLTDGTIQLWHQYCSVFVYSADSVVSLAVGDILILSSYIINHGI
jgi:hypothetical protein